MGRMKVKKPKKAASHDHLSAWGYEIDPHVMEMTPEETTAFIEEMKALLPPEKSKVVVGMTALLAFLVAELKAKRVSISRLKALLYGEKTEKTSRVIKGKSKQRESLPKDREKQPGHGRNGASSYPGADTTKIPHETLKPGDECPVCPKGRVYPIKSGVLVRIVGMSPLSATVVELDKFRCNACGEIFTAKLPEGMDARRFDESAMAMVALLKYGAGTPFYRIERLQRNLGIPMPASTQWDMVERAAEKLEPVFEELMNIAAQADVVHNDDTTMKLLDRPDLKLNEEGRKGVYTSGIVAGVRTGNEKYIIALFRTGPRHAGENLEALLKRRKEELEMPIQMCDALSANTKGGFQTILAHCMAHARRRFVDVVDDFPEECTYLLETLGKVYEYDAKTKEMSPPERLRYHQEHSKPLMEALKKWLDETIEKKLVEPNSGLGEAIAYMRKHWEPLTLFLREIGAPIDNNICERALKRAVLHRKNSLFYKTQKGAWVGDCFMSFIHTAELNDVNPFDYLVETLKNIAMAEENPEEWMPWNFHKTLQALPQ
jgi:transposase